MWCVYCKRRGGGRLVPLAALPEAQVHVACQRDAERLLADDAPLIAAVLRPYGLRPWGPTGILREWPRLCTVRDEAAARVAIETEAIHGMVALLDTRNTAVRALQDRERQQRHAARMLMSGEEIKRIQLETEWCRGCSVILRQWSEPPQRSLGLAHTERTARRRIEAVWRRDTAALVRAARPPLGGPGPGDAAVQWARVLGRVPVPATATRFDGRYALQTLRCRVSLPGDDAEGIHAAVLAALRVEPHRVTLFELLRGWNPAAVWAAVRGGTLPAPCIPGRLCVRVVLASPDNPFPLHHWASADACRVLTLSLIHI